MTGDGMTEDDVVTAEGVPTRHPGRRRCLRVVLATALAVLVATASGRGQSPAPSRLVSTSPSITETLFALGLGARVVGVSTYCRYPETVRTLPKVGSFLKPDAEIIARLKPDLVYVHAGPHAVATQLSSLGIRTAVVDRGSLPAVFDTIRQISAAAGVPDRGQSLVRRLQQGLNEIETQRAGRFTPRVMVVVGRRTGTLMDLVGVGPGSYLHDLIGIAGGVNVLQGTAQEYPRISLESVIALAPDVVIDVGEMGEDQADAMRRQRATRTLWDTQPLVAAVRRGRVHAVVDEAFVVPGPRVVDVTRAMATWFAEVEPR